MGALTQNYWFNPISIFITGTRVCITGTFVNAKGTEVLGTGTKKHIINKVELLAMLLNNIYH